MSLAVFALSAIALLATTPGPPTARSEASGELYVSPSGPAHVEVRFAVVDPAPDEITRIAVNPTVGYDSDARFESSVNARVGRGEWESERHDRYGIPLDPAECASGCEVVATIDATWRGKPEPGMRVAWTLELEVEYLNRVPEEATSTTAISGDEVPPRLTWLALGALLAVAAGVGMWLTRPRWPALRLVLAAGLLVPAAWPLVLLAGDVERWLAGQLIIGTETLVLVSAGVLLAIGVAVGMARAVGGRVAVLSAVGWMAALTLGYVWWAIAINVGTYRPHEMIALTAALGVSAAAAITAVPIRIGSAEMRSIGAGTTLIMAIQGMLVVIAILVAGTAFVAFAGTLLSGRAPDLAMLGAVLAAIAVAALFTFGWLDWRQGSMRNIYISNSIALVAAFGLGIIVLLQGDMSLLSVGIELRVLAALVMATVLVGTIGLRVVDPPLADEKGDAEGGERYEIGRIADEEDGVGLRDGT